MRVSDPSNPIYDELRQRGPSHRAVTDRDLIYNALFGPLFQPSTDSPRSNLYKALNPDSRPKSYQDLPLPNPFTEFLSTKLPESIPLLGGSPIGDFVPVISEIPATQDRLSVLARPRVSIADYASLPAEAISAASPIKLTPRPSPTREAWKGVKRHPAYYHGVRSGSDEDFERIYKEGFTRGSSAELGLPGTSISEDPLVSYQHFTNPDKTPRARAQDVLAVEVDTPPSEVYNLSPEKYISGEVPSMEPGTVYKKPNAFYHEAETFGVREVPDYSENLEAKPKLPPFTADDMRSNQYRHMKDQINVYDKFQSDISQLNHRSYQLDTFKRQYPDSPLPPDLSKSFKPEIQNVASAIRDLRGNRGTMHNVLMDIPSQLGNPHFWEGIREVAGDATALRLAKLKNQIDSFLEHATNNPEDITSDQYRAYMRAKDQFTNEFASLAPGKPPSRKPKLPD